MIAMFEGYRGKRRRPKSAKLSAWQHRFSKAAKACKGKKGKGFRTCLKQKLKGRK